MSASGNILDLIGLASGILVAASFWFLLRLISREIESVLSELKQTKSILHSISAKLNDELDRSVEIKLDSNQVREINQNLIEIKQELVEQRFKIDNIVKELNWWDQKTPTLAGEILRRLDRTP